MAVGVQLSLSAPKQALGGDPARAEAKTRSKRGLATAKRLAGMVELVDTLCSGRSDRMVVRVQLSLPAPHSIAVEPVSTGREREPKGSLFFFPPRPRPSLRFFSFAFLSFFLLFSSLFSPPPRALFFDSSSIPLASTRPDRRLGPAWMRLGLAFAARAVPGWAQPASGALGGGGQARQILGCLVGMPCPAHGLGF